MKRAIGYVRVSTEGQEDKFGVEAQKEAIRNYAKEKGYEVHSWFCDTVSGVAEHREEWDKILQSDTVANPPFEAVIVYKSDRVARDIKLFFYFEWLLKKKGVELISVNDGFPDVAEEYKNIIKSFILFSAEQERRNINLRTSNGRKVKASLGGYAGGRYPYGYDVVDGKLVINEEKAKLVREIFRMRQKEYKTYVQIADKMNEWDKTKKWYHSHIVAILNCERIYRGEYKYGNGEWVKGLHEPILKD